MLKGRDVNKTKKKGLLFIMILVLCVVGISFFYFYSIKKAKAEREKAILQVEESAEQLGAALGTMAQSGQKKLISDYERQVAPIIERLKKGDTQGIKVVFLTFDDGPSAYTAEVLGILKTYGIKGTFFTYGRQQTDAYAKIIKDGHTLGNHTYSHDYSLYKNPEVFFQDVQKEDDYQKSFTGQASSMLFRFPGGSNNANGACVQGILDRGYNYADWNVDSGDGVSKVPNPKILEKNIIDGVHKLDVSVVLCHAELKENTRKALPGVIKRLKAEGYTFLPMTAALEVYPRY